MPNDQDPPQMELPTPEQFATTACAECGKVGCRAVFPTPEGTFRFVCAEHEPEEIREGRLRALTTHFFQQMAASGLTFQEGLSVATILLRFMGYQAQEGVEALQQGLVEAEPVFQKLFPEASAEAVVTGRPR